MSTALRRRRRRSTLRSIIKSLLLTTTLAVVLAFPSAVQAQNDDFLINADNNLQICTPNLRQYPPDATTKTEYRVGVLAIRGADAAYNEFNETFSDYLTATAGQQFDPPVQFTMVPLNFLSLFSDVELAIETSGALGVDFIYVNPSAFSCIESEYGANTLVSQISRRVVGGREYELTKFGGVIFSRADNDDIDVIEDIRDKVVACASISGLGSGQMQFRLLQQKGLAYIQDPKQLVFTSNQGKVVNGVLQGKFDVGLVRTDQLERTTDARTGELVDLSEIKIINAGTELLDGKPFPFQSSTILYPEWNVASLSHVIDDVAIEVQNAMLAIAEHATVGAAINACIVENNCVPDPATNIFAPDDVCYNQCLEGLTDDTLRCDSTAALSLLAHSAKTSGKYAGWRSTLSYMELRNMQQETNFIRKKDDGVNACIRSAQIVDAVVCPPGHFRKPAAKVLTGCADAGLDCGEFQCLCKPCVKAFDVDVAPMLIDGDIQDACPKFAICGQVEQSKTLTFRATDNKEREEPNLQVRILEGAREMDLQVQRITKHTFEFTFDASDSSPGIAIFEVYADGEQIPESPFRFEITERQCDTETGDDLKEVDEEGNCVCQGGSHEIGGTCVTSAVLIPSILVPLLVILLLSVYFYVEHKKKQADSVWAVKPSELVFNDPPLILGRGTFGLVLLAEYRGTQVAVKRVIPPKLAKKVQRMGAMSSNWKNSLLGDGDMDGFEDVPEQRQDIEFDFNDSKLKVDNSSVSFDAMESGGLPKMPSNSSFTEDASVASSKRPRRRASLTGNQIKANSLFDFSNLDRGDSIKFSKSQSDVGCESGGMQKVFERLNEAEPPKQLASRRHSIAAIGAGIGRSLLADLDLSDDEDDGNKQPKLGKMARRGSASGGMMARRGSASGNMMRQDTGTSSASALDIPPSRQARRRNSLGSSNLSKKSSGLLQFGRRKSGDDSIVEEDEEEPGPDSSQSGMSRIDSSSKVGRRDSDASYNLVDVQEFNRMIEEEENINAAVVTLAAKSGTFALKSARSSGGSLRNASSSGQRNNSGGLMSMKKIKESVFGKGDEYVRLKQEFVSEMRHLSKLRHPCITTVMGAVISKKSEPMLVMEYMDHGSLYDLVHNESMIVDGELVLPILRDIAQGVRFLHAADPQVIHGDLKAQNVLVDSKFRAKVADFGLSQKKKVGATGTPLWMAPELLRGESENTAMSDVYSFGIILYEVYSRKDPYEGQNHLTVLREVADPEINKHPIMPKTCPPKIASIMADCLAPEAHTRPTFEELDLRLKRLDVENVQPGQTIFSMQKKKEERAARSEMLLFEVFPQHIAEALRDGRKCEAESFDCVSIFFSDIVGYTTISSKLHPKKVSDMLDRLYTAFDELSIKHDVFKIETIGDAYMAVTNLHKDQEDHAARLARFSIDAIEATSKTLIDTDDPAIGYVKIRVGFHCGPIVADVVGSRSPKYTLFGDTVNTASRMESNSLPGRIQCSERTADLIKVQDPSLPLVARGKINVKGKGDMFTYWVNEFSSLKQDAAVLDPEQCSPPLDSIVEGMGG